MAKVYVVKQDDVAIYSAIAAGPGLVIPDDPDYPGDNIWMSVPTDANATAEPPGCAARQADGSVKVAQAGWYHASASVRVDAPGSTLGHLHAGLSTNASPSEGDIANQSLSNVYTLGWFSLDGDVYLPADQAVYVHVWIYPSDVTLTVDRFSLYRVA